MKRSIFITATLLSICAFANEEVAYQNNNVCPSEKCDYGQGHGRDVNQMSCGYNAPARYDICGCWDFYANASFIYWQPLQEYLTFASTFGPQIGIGSAPFLNGSIVTMNYDYKPGFKVGLGLGSDYDNWDIFLEYTWYHLTKSRTVQQPDGGRLLYINWFTFQNAINSGIDEAITASSVTGSWKLDMDLLDFELARKYYLGTKLTFRPYIGARAAWIKQSMSVNAVVLGNIGPRRIKVTSDCWGLGPRFGLDTNWHLGCGFRALGNVATSLLYTDYHKLTRDEDQLNFLQKGPTFMQLNSKLKYLRPNLELALGFGWGSYFGDNAYHYDLVVGYDFNVYFQQNMLRYSVVETGIQSAPGNLYTHGLNVSMQFDF